MVHASIPGFHFQGLISFTRQMESHNTCTLNSSIANSIIYQWLSSVCWSTWRRAQGRGGWCPAEGPPHLQLPLLPLQNNQKSCGWEVWFENISVWEEGWGVETTWAGSAMEEHQAGRHSCLPLAAHRPSSLPIGRAQISPASGWLNISQLWISIGCAQFGWSGVAASKNSMS